MDNRVFDINGRGQEMLLAAITLACYQQRGCYGEYGPRTIDGWRVSPTSGLVLTWAVRPEIGDQKFITPLKPEDVVGMVMSWLQTEEAQKIPPVDCWDEDCDHDGHNSVGWRASCGGWGHVDGQWGAIVAIRPTYLWHGK